MRLVSSWETSSSVILCTATFEKIREATSLSLKVSISKIQNVAYSLRVATQLSKYTIFKILMGVVIMVLFYRKTKYHVNCDAKLYLSTNSTVSTFVSDIWYFDELVLLMMCLFFPPRVLLFFLRSNLTSVSKVPVSHGPKREAAKNL